MKRDVIKCLVCGNSFSAPSRKGCIPKYCSDTCRHKVEKDKLRTKADLERMIETRACLVCGEVFTARGKGYHRRYCSDKCSSKAEHIKRNTKRRDNAPLLPCAFCGKQFKKLGTRKYCSSECYIEAKRPIERIDICPMCKTEITLRGNKHKYCSKKCADKAQEKVYRKNSTTRRALRKTNGHVEKINPEDIFNRDGWKCQLCGKKVSKGLYKTKGTKRHAGAPSLDHIVPLSRGGEHTKINVQCTCYACNMKKNNKIKGQMRLFG